ncbi:hypothetical protein CBR_g13023 [Chara braunii]|uniref:Outer arm dynein light chain 1 protein n=1 Tax=Chara braunii TaxID=69332 RepID=A0A388KTB5_CHABU|nr:hypothetical protein CBR_g13023 [Chara braunii]|eukprot:GBG73304.1 hypothetical protein CBR_g13023 [Chara braunii]
MGATVSGGVGTHHAGAVPSDKRLQQRTPGRSWPPSSQMEGMFSIPDGGREGALSAAPVGAAAHEVESVGRLEAFHPIRDDNSSKTPQMRTQPLAISSSGLDVATAVQHRGSPHATTTLQFSTRPDAAAAAAVEHHLTSHGYGHAVVSDVVERMDAGWRYGSPSKIEATRRLSSSLGRGTGGPRGGPQRAVEQIWPLTTDASSADLLVNADDDLAVEKATTGDGHGRPSSSSGVDGGALAAADCISCVAASAADLGTAENAAAEDGGGLGDDEGGHASDRDYESEAKSRRVFSELSESEAIVGELIPDRGSIMYYEETEGRGGCLGQHVGNDERKSRTTPTTIGREGYLREAVSSASDPGGYCARSDGHGAAGMAALYSHQEMEDETSAYLMSHDVENATTFLSREEEDLGAIASSDSVVSLGELTIVSSPKAATDGGLNLDLERRTRRDARSCSTRDAEGSVVDSMVGFTAMASACALPVDEDGEGEEEEEANRSIEEVCSLQAVTDDEGMNTKKYYESSKEEGEAELRSYPTDEQQLELASAAEEVGMGDLRSDPGPCREMNGSDGSDAPIGVQDAGKIIHDSGAMDLAFPLAEGGSTEVPDWSSNSFPREVEPRAINGLGRQIPEEPSVKGGAAAAAAAAVSSSKRRTWWKSLFGSMKGSANGKDREEHQEQRQGNQHSNQGLNLRWKVGSGNPLHGKEGGDTDTAPASNVSTRSESGVAGTVSSKLGWSSDRKKVGAGHWFKWEKGDRPSVVETAPATASQSGRTGGDRNTHFLLGRCGSGILLDERNVKGAQLGGAREERSVSVQSAPNLLALIAKEQMPVQPPPTPSSVLAPASLESRSSWLDLKAIENASASAGAIRKTWVMEWLDRLDVSPGAWDVPEEDVIHEEIESSSTRPAVEKRMGTVGNLQGEGAAVKKAQWKRSLSLNSLTEKNVAESRAVAHVAGGADGGGLGTKDSATVADMDAAAAILQHLDKTANAVAISGQSLKLVPAFGAFSNLRNLDLSRNSIARILPGSLPRSLHVLDLSYNKLSVIEGLRDLTRLQVLKLSFNRIVRIGHGLSSCTSLRELYLQYNKISEIEGLHRLLKLTVLDLSHNKLTSMKALGQLAANYKSLQALSLKGNPIVTNVSGEPFRKFIMGLVPHLLYLNQELIKPIPGRDGLNESLAKTVLGPTGYNTQRASRPRKYHRSSQTGHSKVHSSSSGHQSRSASQSGGQDNNARRHKSSTTKASKQSQGSSAKHLHNGSLARHAVGLIHPHDQQQYQDGHYYGQQADEVERAESMPVKAVNIANEGLHIARPIKHVKSESALASATGNYPPDSFSQDGEACGFEFSTEHRPSEVCMDDVHTMWGNHLYAVGSFSHWNRQGRAEMPDVEGEVANHAAFPTMQVRVPCTVGLGPVGSVMAS